MKEDEFEVKEAPGGGDTFQVIVSDMKKIIDREFNRKNEAGENKYGQKIVLTYQATLNERAAKNTDDRDLKMMSDWSFPMILIQQ